MEHIEGYDILEKIGEGGMGQVYRALHLRLDRQVAIKRLAPQLSHNQDMLQRFLKEARLQARLPHPNVVSIFDLIENEQGVFLIMEYVEGQTAKDMLAGRDRLTMTETIMIADGVLCGLDFMHRNGVVHRDIKPSNIMVSRDGTVKVTDFGIARLVDEESGLTRFGGIGTLHYMAPELIRSGTVSFSVDIYGLGATLHELLSGAPPFVGNTDLEIMMGHLERTPLPLDRLPDDAVGRGCRDFVAKALAKTPEDRFPSAEAFLAEVRRVRALLPPEALWPVTDPAILGTRTAAAPAGVAPLAASAPTVWGGTSLDQPGGGAGAEASRTRIAPGVAAPSAVSDVTSLAQPAAGAAPAASPAQAASAPAAVEPEPATPAPPAAAGEAVPDRPQPGAVRPGGGRRTVFAGVAAAVVLGVAGYLLLGTNAEKPVRPQDASVRTAEAPPRPQEIPAVPQDASARPQEASAQLQDAPARPQEVPARTAEAPAAREAAAAVAVAAANEASAQPVSPPAAPATPAAPAVPAASAAPAQVVSGTSAAPAADAQPVPVQAAPAAPAAASELQAEPAASSAPDTAPAAPPTASVPQPPAAAPFPPVAPAGREQKPAKPAVVYAAAAEVRLRERPDAAAAVTARLEKGTRLEVLARESDWLQVAEPGGRTGYVSAKLTAPTAPSPAPASPPPAARAAKQAPARPASKSGGEAQSGWSIVK
ncbi:serine/threonine-protein kinase [Solidesulfovibrio sp.]|uniref:serine/threonine-protein kinase n=1 Tax=Solidesulfovibrio sp. TaxID=2910990 RepID=UPI002630C373|nr:serine/threonine-protein kinase [Solidesulfovibrio sp.]